MGGVRERARKLWKTFDYTPPSCHLYNRYEYPKLSTFPLFFRALSSLLSKYNRVIEINSIYHCVS